MKNILAVSAFAILIGTSFDAMAQQNQGGFAGPGIAPMSVAEVKKLGDDTNVVMVGKIEKSLGGEKYTFTDETGSVTVEIDNEDWGGVVANPQDIVEIHGEVDKGLTTFEIDVERVVKK